MELLIVIFALGTATGALLAPLVFVLLDGLAFVIWIVAEVAGIIIVILVGTLLDVYHNQLVRMKKKPYRLPWYLRWNGWSIAGVPPKQGLTYTPRLKQMGMYYSSRKGSFVAIARYGR